ncbi:OLC1v1006936C1 [Oldenlandia corymbosa var. corymbosa]|uniref:OLC1v1006936C1 n=1 Tax=Oldenlandia corymbosa var. corymbosa TaxID=529605 RepID=A0AAV1DIM5_OLDCO|nr:OLC1v1006936C1 [Oldenlandia corymbosa var. corymbosa]
MNSLFSSPLSLSPNRTETAAGKIRKSSTSPLSIPADTNKPPKPNKLRRLSMSLNQNPIIDTTKFLDSITKLLWGQSLPPQLVISTVRSTWTTAWHVIMSQMAPSDSSGGYNRPASKFRLQSPANFPPDASLQSLHLYVGLPCPWAHRALIVRALKGLEDAIPVSIASPGMDGSWEFRDNPPANLQGGRGKLIPTSDKAQGCKTLREVYGLRRGGYNGRSTVPMLWDAKNKNVICNESYDIIQFFNSGLNGVAGNPGLDLEPPSLTKKIDEWNQIIYPNVNNGVYRCGFAQSQEAYDTAVNELFTTLDMIDDHLGGSRYLCGDDLTLADICLFTTLVRFDIVYNVLFKCTKKKLIEYQNLHAYLRDIYQIPKVAATCNLVAIMDGYYKTLFPLNPGGIRPILPSHCQDEALSKPHNRSSVSTVGEAVNLGI